MKNYFNKLKDVKINSLKDEILSFLDKLKENRKNKIYSIAILIVIFIIAFIAYLCCSASIVLAIIIRYFDIKIFISIVGAIISIAVMLASPLSIFYILNKLY